MTTTDAQAKGKKGKQDKRAGYSHTGCAHCKKVRQKCDEKKPSCTACAKMNHECVYLHHIVMWTPGKREPSSRASKAKAERKEATEPAAPPQPSPLQDDLSPISSSSISTDPSISSTLLSTDAAAFPPTYQDNSRNYSQPNLSQPIGNLATKNDNGSNLGFLFGLNEDSLLSQPGTNPSNASSTAAVSPSNFFTSPESLDFTNNFESDTPENSSISMAALYNIPQWTEYGVTEWKRIMRGYRPSSFSNEQDMQRFMEYVFLRAKCGFNYPFGVDENNPLWRSIMNVISRFDHLRYVVLSVATNILQYECKCSEWAPFRRKYMDACMQSLIESISSYKTNDQISTLFATVMILFSDRSASVGNKWRLHLRGALELLNARNPEVPGTDDLFGVLRSWFSLAETYAWISSPNGGTITPDLNAMEILDDSKYAYSVDGLVLGGFNTFKCYGQSAVPFFAQAACLKMKLFQGIPYDENVCFELIQKIGALINEEFDLTKVPNPTVRTAMQSSHKLHCMGLQLYVMHKLLKQDITSQSIQATLLTMTPIIQSFPFSETLGVAIHWPVFMAGVCSAHIETRTIVEAHLNEVIAVGLYVARNSLFRLHKFWELFDEGSTNVYSEDTDSIAF